MDVMYTQIISNITRSKISGGILVGNTVCSRVKDVKVNNGQHGWLDRTITITMENGNTYTVVQYDRGYFELRGPYLVKGLDVDGWADAVRLLENGF